MTDIIKVELFRLKKSALFWALLGVVAICPLLSVLLNIVIILMVNGAEGNALETLRAAGLTKTLLQSSTMISCDAALLALITSSVLLSREFVDGTMRNVVLANKSRAALYFGYLLTSLIVAVTYLTAYYVVTLVIVAPVFGFGGVSAGKAVSAVLCSFALGLFAVTFIESCVCMFVFGVRKQWAAILFPLLILFFVPTTFQTILTIFTMAMASNGQAVTIDTQRWIPFVNVQYLDPTAMDGALAAINILYLSVFITVFTVSGYYTFKKADLK